MFSECECFGIEKDSCGIYAVTVKALIIVAVFFPKALKHPVLCHWFPVWSGTSCLESDFFKGLSACLRSSYGRSGRHRNVAINLFVF